MCDDRYEAELRELARQDGIRTGRAQMAQEVMDWLAVGGTNLVAARLAEPDDRP